MIEAYVLLSLLGIGYLLNQRRPVQLKTTRQQLQTHETPSMTNIYESNYSREARRIEEQQAKKAFNAAMSNPDKVVPLNPQTFPRTLPPTTVKSDLSGRDIPLHEFEHNNMLPFFRGSVKQNVDDKDLYGSVLERYTGYPENDIKKTEIEPLFKPEKNVGNVNGVQNSLDFQKERIVPSYIRHNEVPFDKIMVGPGVNQGYNDEGTGGFHQFEMQELMKPKTVDDLRVKSNPKLTFEGRTVDGMKGKVAGEVGQVFKHRPPTFKTQTQDDLFKTTGAYLKEKQKPIIEVKHTNRRDTTTSYTGVAYRNKEISQRADVEPSARNQLDGPSLGTAAMQERGMGEGFDYGKASILVYANERDVTTTRTHQGNLTSLVKAIIAPLEDALRLTKRVHTTEHPREQGELQPQFPSKPTIYDPNQVARTTIKETLIHDTVQPNIDVPKQGFVYDPDDFKPKTTGRETLDAIDNQLNLASRRQTGVVYDPTDVAKTTVKETNIHDSSDQGRVVPIDQQRGSYTETDYVAKLTQKEFLTQNSQYTGIADKEGGDGYKVANVDMKTTHKQFTSDHEYFGQAEDTQAKRPTSYEDIYNATISEVKELLLQGREPTSTNVKLNQGKEAIRVESRKILCDPIAARESPNAGPLTGGSIVGVEQAPNMTRQRQVYMMDDRVDANILTSLSTNPFVISKNV
jgi:hypothetical protein